MYLGISAWRITVTDKLSLTKNINKMDYITSIPINQYITPIKFNLSDVMYSLIQNHTEYGCFISSCGIKMYYLPPLNCT